MLGSRGSALAEVPRLARRLHDLYTQNISLGLIGASLSCASWIFS